MNRNDGARADARKRALSIPDGPGAWLTDDELARVIADAKAEALREAADDIAGRLRRGENPDLGHVAVDWLRNRAEATR